MLAESELCDEKFAYDNEIRNKASLEREWHLVGIIFSLVLYSLYTDSITPQRILGTEVL